MIRFLLLLTCLVAASGLKAQNQKEVPEMETDRPGQTESAKVVPQGFVQIESGFKWEQDNDNGIVAKEFNYPATIVRIGVLKFAELRLQGEFKRETEEIAATDIKTEKIGFARTGLGVKVHLWEGRRARPEVALLTHVIVPWGSQSYNAKLVEPDAMLTFANELTEKVGLVYSIGGRLESHKPEETETDPRKYDHIYFYTLQLTNNFTDHLQGFVEYYGQKQEGTRHMHHLDTGLAWKVLPHLQLDLLGGIGLSKDAPDFFMETGVSIRLPR